LRGDAGTLGYVNRIAGGIDTGGINTLATATQGAVPGLTARLHGELPSDVINQIMQQAAERGIATGTGFRGADYLKALGLTSLGVSTQAAGELESQIGRAPLIDPNRLIVTPEQQQEAQTAANIYQSAPIPSAAAGAAIGNAQMGLRQGMGAVPTFSGGGAYGMRDALGFPITPDAGSFQDVPQTAAYGALNPTAPTSPSTFNWADYARSITPNNFGPSYSPDESYLSDIYANE
jgi:hypothetical protein